MAEGERTEYEYFGHVDQKYGQHYKFRINTPPRSVQRNGLSPSQVVEEAAVAARDSAIYEAWGLFDHDNRPNIDQACAAADRQGVSGALSHPAFELWLLLHFQEFSPARQGGSNDEIIRKLRNAHPAFANYSSDNKGISLERFGALADGDGIVKAVSRARRLAAEFTSETPGNRDPSTGVYRLIENLGIAGGSR